PAWGGGAAHRRRWAPAGGAPGAPRRERYGREAGLGPNEFRPVGPARRLVVPRGAVRRWLRPGRLSARRDEDGHHLIGADADGLRRLRELHQLAPARATRARPAGVEEPPPPAAS